MTASSETKVAKVVLSPGSDEGLEVMTEAVVGNSGGKIPSPDVSQRSPKDEAVRGDMYLARGVSPPAAAKRGRGRGSPAIDYSLATVCHDGRRPSVAPVTGPQK